MPQAQLEKETAEVIALYPHDIGRFLATEIDRYAFQASLLISPSQSLADLGCGVSPYPIVCRRHGMTVTMIDDYGDPGEDKSADGVLQVHRDEGIQVVRGDVLSMRLPFDDSSLDLVSSFSSLDHWHHSPKHLYAEIRRVLKPGGRLILGAPNAVNLFKRIKVLFGRTNNVEWRWMYEEGTPWRGHVREPVMSELHDVCRWNGFRLVRQVGRNFRGSRMKLLDTAPGRVFMRSLELFPTLCREIFIIAQKEQ